MLGSFVRMFSLKLSSEPAPADENVSSSGRLDVVLSVLLIFLFSNFTEKV